MRARSGFWSVFTALFMPCYVQWSDKWDQAVWACPALLLGYAPLETTEDHTCPAELGSLANPVAAEGVLALSKVPAPLWLFCFSWGLLCRHKAVDVNLSRTAEATETQFNWPIDWTITWKMCCAVRRDRLLNDFTLTRWAVLRAAAIQRPLASWLKDSETKLRNSEPHQNQVSISYWLCRSMVLLAYLQKWYIHICALSYPPGVRGHLLSQWDAYILFITVVLSITWC